MGDLLKPLTDTFNKKTTSKQMVKEFLEKDPVKWPSAEVDITETGRTEQNVYLSLKSYVDRHPELGVGVLMNGGKVILTRIGG